MLLKKTLHKKKVFLQGGAPGKHFGRNLALSRIVNMWFQATWAKQHKDQAVPSWRNHNGSRSWVTILDSLERTKFLPEWSRQGASR